MNIYSFIIGLMIGGTGGFFFAALCNASRRADDIEKELFEKRFGDNNGQTNIYN